jgi:hypothetical protein
MSDETSEDILKQGVLQTFGTFCIHDNEEMMSICVHMLCAVSITASGRSLLVQKASYMKGLFSLIRSKCRDTQLSCAKAVLNLLMFTESRLKAATNGALQLIEILATLNDYADDLCYLSVSNEGRAQMVKEHAADAALIVLAKRCKTDNPVEALVASTLQYMSWSKIAQNNVV